MPDTSDFAFDVFLSHSAKDKELVRSLAQRLHQDGLKVWFDDWVLKPGDSIPAKIEEGLEQSRVLVLCMSANAFGSDWAKLESGIFRFRDPQNKERRFIPLRLDDGVIKGSLAQFVYIDWRRTERKREYRKLLAACRPSRESSATPEPIMEFGGPVDAVTPEPKAEEGFLVGPNNTAGRCLRVLTGHKKGVLALALSPGADVVASGSRDNSIKIWSIADGRCIRTLLGHTKAVREIVIDSNQRLYSACEDGSIGVWSLATGGGPTFLKGHLSAVYSLALTPDQKSLVSGSKDATMRVWDLATLKCKKVMKYGRGWVNAIVFLPDGKDMIVGTEDGLITIWNLREARQTAVLDEHSLWVWGLAVTPDGSTLVSGSGDTTVGLWDLKRRRRTTFLEGHRDKVSKVAVTKDGRWAISGALDNTARVWNLMNEEFAASLTGHDDSVESVAISTDGRLALTGSDDGKIAVWNLELDAGPIISSSAVTRYTNAKVVLVGESGVGKTGLSKRLALSSWEPSDSTVGAWATQWKLPVPSGEDVEREIWLWDFGGQADQRLIHQLYMDETALAILVFDGQKEDLFETLGQWNRDLTRASRKDLEPDPKVGCTCFGCVIRGVPRESRNDSACGRSSTARPTSAQTSAIRVI